MVYRLIMTSPVGSAHTRQTALAAEVCRKTSMSSPLSQLWRSSWTLGLNLLTDPRYLNVLAGLVILGDAVLIQLIIRFVPCQRVHLLALMAVPT